MTCDAVCVSSGVARCRTCAFTVVVVTVSCRRSKRSARCALADVCHRVEFEFACSDDRSRFRPSSDDRPNTANTDTGALYQALAEMADGLFHEFEHLHGRLDKLDASLKRIETPPDLAPANGQ